jgi:hypothetical protein
VLNEIKSFLEGANSNFAKLYFMEKNRDKETKEISYNSLKTKIGINVGQDLINCGLNQIEKILKKNDIEYTEYQVLPYSDKTHIETISKDDVPFLNNIILQISNQSIDKFDDKKTSKIHGYIVKIETKNETLLLFKKHSPKKLLEKGIMSLIVRNGTLDKLNEDILALEEHYDAALLLKGEENYTPKVLVLNRPQFEYLFSFTEFYTDKVNSMKNDFDTVGLIDDSDKLINICQNNFNMMRKLCRTLENGAYKEMSMENIRDCCDKFNVDGVDFDSDGKLIVTEDNIWTILRILDDDHLSSDYTELMYEARSKVKR